MSSSAAGCISLAGSSIGVDAGCGYKAKKQSMTLMQELHRIYRRIVIYPVLEYPLYN
jgi:hypothetical protein